jgi:hypothetical protein
MRGRPAVLALPACGGGGASAPTQASGQTGTAAETASGATLPPKDQVVDASELFGGGNP